ncbi:similar to Saccharomyces cerevisiae YGL162W SUT1 Transcription factor of the Zn[II]2Cys6 family involved in sterol uptake [Maudiozyma saulgeensis]|uniref:Similar to Saccharomyces cerevisiae YGL162W SUT1 Transcription factor of the Zn[II]2Cys6 family involved in sterol uptake n=1 Tax=Maudiozyma saulgeensis TaxID=1789683 RepID=A0A1X7QYU0_9SACH|nr:similar to Saccharomyces cerevisiae YGL162W SUT1 Transcription factor of the Zn[II]2Cys6 family involved in sterol uptake [Kazachstania saulgeensis]
MNTASITISNRDEDLPPLLLPSINPNIRNIMNGTNNIMDHHHHHHHQDNSNDSSSTSSSSNAPTNIIKIDPFLHKKRQLENTNIKKEDQSSTLINGLESLASLATKRPKLSSTTSNNNATMPANLLMGLHHNIHTPPPLLNNNNNTTTTTTTTTTNTGNSTPHSIDTPRSITPASGIPSRSVTPLRKNQITSNVSPTSSVSSSSTTTNSQTSKRQRVGPSCDKCRLKKIKCDAHIEVLVQDESVLTFATDLLHYALTRDDVIRHRTVLESQFHIGNDTLDSFLKQSFDNYNPHAGNKQFINYLSIIKHIDKLILFKPCLSCCKKKHSAIITGFVTPNPYTEFLNCCTFSKGFTRADINIFSRISKNINGKTIYEMNTNDYKNAGF